MWFCLNDAFFSIVRKPDLPAGHVLVRARRPGDIEGRWPEASVQRTPGRDYLFRAIIPEGRVASVVAESILAIDYGNFKDSVGDRKLHDAYFRIWEAMGRVQRPGRYGNNAS